MAEESKIFHAISLFVRSSQRDKTIRWHHDDQHNVVPLLMPNTLSGVVSCGAVRSPDSLRWKNLRFLWLFFAITFGRHVASQNGLVLHIGSSEGFLWTPVLHAGCASNWPKIGKTGSQPIFKIQPSGFGSNFTPHRDAGCAAGIS